MRGLRLLAVSCVMLAGFAGSAAAHVTLEQGEAAADSAYKAVLRVGHGCEGAATTALRVQIPEGLIVAKPMPKPGWQVELKEGDYAKSYDYFDTPVTKGVKEIAWTGGNLPDNFYDEFVFRVRVTSFEPAPRSICRWCRNAAPPSTAGSRSRKPASRRTTTSIRRPASR